MGFSDRAADLAPVAVEPPPHTTAAFALVRSRRVTPTAAPLLDAFGLQLRVMPAAEAIPPDRGATWPAVLVSGYAVVRHQLGTSRFSADGRCRVRRIERQPDDTAITRNSKNAQTTPPVNKPTQQPKSPLV